MLKKTLLAIGAILLSLLVALGAWAFIEPYVLDEEEVTAPVPSLPTEWEGQRVALLADFQIGLWGDNDATAEEAIEEIIEARPRPAMVLFAGDFIYRPEDDTAEIIQRSAEIMRPLQEAGIPTYAVLGNHDYGVESNGARVHQEEVEELIAAMEEAGVKILQNEAIRLPAPGGEEAGGQPLYLVGMDSLWAKQFRPDRALADVPGDAPRIVMMHNPDGFDQLPPHSAPFTVAGHTHGGQLRIPGLPHSTYLSLVQSDTEKIHADHWYYDYGARGNDIYVNRGIGMSHAPIRLFCPPELTWITLKRGLPRDERGFGVNSPRSAPDDA